jgi:hypothetical protein
MKLRMQKNSIRFRLSPHDLEQLAAESFLQEVIVFSPDKTFHFRVELAVQLEKPELDYQSNRLNFRVPEFQGRRWLESNTVEIIHLQEHPESQNLQIILEKDLKPHRK